MHGPARMVAARAAVPAAVRAAWRRRRGGGGACGECGGGGGGELGWKWRAHSDMNMNVPHPLPPPPGTGDGSQCADEPASPGSGVEDADFVLMVTAQQSTSCGDDNAQSERDCRPPVYPSKL